MLHLFNLLLIALVLLNTTGLGLLAHRWSRLPYGLSLGAAVLIACSLPFFVEHFFGLGALGWLLPLGTLGSAWLVWKQRHLLLENRGANGWLLLGFFYALAWRYTYPSIDGNTERLPDLSFVAAYARGEHLPPPDLWYPPFTLNHYYSFQHYGAGLLGRFLSINAGTAYNLAFCLLTGLTMAAAYEAVRALCRLPWAQALVLGAFLVGGPGTAVLTPFMVKTDGLTVEKPWDAQRFIGGTTFYENEKLTPFGQWIKQRAQPDAKATREQVQEIPMETLSYVVQLGDYHAPLGGFFLLAFTLGLAVVLRAAPAHPIASALLAATVPWTIATDTWSLPLQVFLIVALLGYLGWLRRPAVPAEPRLRFGGLNLPALALGLAATGFLFYPYFSYFLVNNVGNKAPIRFVPTSTVTTLTPPFLFFLVFWPLLLVGLLHLLGVRREQKLQSVFWLLLLGFTELFFVDDIYGGSAERFNTTLKWWPWVFNGALLTLGAANLASPVRWRRWGTVIALVGVNIYAIQLARYWWQPVRAPGNWKESKNDFGRLDGANWLRRDHNVASVLDFLKAEPPGIVLESPDERAFCTVGAFALFTNHPALIGWASHENLWRGDQTDINNRYDQARSFYRGELPEPLRFLQKYGVRYILWLPRDNPSADSPPETLAAAGEKFQTLSAALAPDYDWHQFYSGDPYHIGIWVKR